jgi:hypothetical protein
MTGRRGDPPARLVTRLRRLCLALPEVAEEAAWVGTRWTIRKRNVAHVVAIADGYPPAYAKAAGTDGPRVVLTIRAAGFLYDALHGAGPPFFTPVWGTQWGTKVIGVALDTGTDWGQIAALITESYRLLAPKALAAAIEPMTLGVRSAPRRSR